MAYTDRNQVIAYMNASDLVPFLDDDGDGNEDAGLLDSIIATMSNKINGRLATIYNVPFAPVVPARVQDFCLVFVCEALYLRRLTPDETNPFKKEAEENRMELLKISSGEIPLDLGFQRAFTPGAVVSCPISFNGTTM